MGTFAGRQSSATTSPTAVAPADHISTSRHGLRTSRTASFAAPRSVQDVLAAPGQPLDRATREFMEPRFRQDFTKVRVHSDPAAERSARELRAHAYTVGNDIVFASGRFASGTPDGQRLIAHELAHVVQQGRAGSAEAGAPAMEQAAEQAAEGVALGSSGPVAGAAKLGIARQDDGSGNQPRLEGEGAQVWPDYKVHEINEPNKAKGTLAELTVPFGPYSGPEWNNFGGGSESKSSRTSLARRSHYDDRMKAEEGTAGTDFLAENVKTGRLVIGEQKATAEDQFVGAGAITQYLEKNIAQNVKALEASKAALKTKSGDVDPSQIQRLQSVIDRLKATGDALERGRKGEDVQLPKGVVFELTNLGGKGKQIGKEHIDLLRKGYGKNPAFLEHILDRTFVRDPKLAQSMKRDVNGQRGTDADPEIVPAKDILTDPAKDRLAQIGSGKSDAQWKAQKAREKKVAEKAAATEAKTQKANVKKQRANEAALAQKQAHQAGEEARKKYLKEQAEQHQNAQPEGTKRERERAAKKREREAKKAGDLAERAHLDKFKAERKAQDDEVQAAGKAEKKVQSDADKQKRKAERQETASKQKERKAEAKRLQMGARRREAAQKIRDAGPTIAGPKPTPKPVSAKPAIPQQSAPEPRVDESPKPVSSPVTKSAAPAPKTAPVTAKAAPPPVSKAAPPVLKAAPPVPKVAPPVPKAAPAASKAAPKSTSTSSTAHISGTPSSLAPSAPKATATTTNMRGGKPIAGANQAGLGATLGRETIRDHGKGVTSTTSSNFDGKVVTNVEEVPNSNPKQYRVSLTVNLGGSVGAGASKQGLNGASAGASLSGSASLTQTWSHQVSKEEADMYLGAARAGAGGAEQELQIAKMVKDGDLRQARQILEGLKKGADPLADPSKLREGDVTSTTAQVQGGGGVNAGYGQFGLSVGATRSGELTRTREVLADGKVRYTVSMIAGKGKSLGGSAGVGAAAFGISEEQTDFQSRSVSFVLDSKDANYQSMLKEVAAADTVDDLAKLQGRHKELVGSKSKGEGSSSQGSTDATLAGVGLSFGRGDRLTHEAIEDESGITNRYEGGASSGLAVKAFGKNIASISADDAFKSTVTPDNRAAGETSSDRAESDYGLSLGKLADSVDNRPRGTALGVATGDTKLLQEKKGSAGAMLDDDSFTRITEQAKSPAAWTNGFPGRVNTDLQDWQQLRHVILAAGPDRNKISIAMADFEHGGSDRSKIVEHVVSDAGYGFDFPDQIADQKDLYRTLVVSDPALAARQLEDSGDRAGAIEEVKRDNKQLGEMLKKINAQEADINPAALAEMTGRIASRRTQLRAELRKLTPAAAPATIAGATTTSQPSAAAAQVEDPAIAEKRAQIEERNAHLSDLIHDALTLKQRETAYFNKIDAEFAKDEHWYSSHDFYDVLNALNEMKKLYPKWDDQIKELGGIYVERGETADRANQFAPNRARWEVLNSKLINSQ